MLKRNQKFGRCHKTASGHHKVEEIIPIFLNDEHLQGHKTASGHHKVEIYALYAEKRISRHKTASGHHKVELSWLHELIKINNASQNRKRSSQGRVR